MLENFREIKEVIAPSKSYIYGVAVSILANDYNPLFPIPEKLPELLSYLGNEGMGAELQLEPLDSSSIPEIPRHDLPFLGVHYPLLVNNKNEILSVKELVNFSERTLLISKQLEADYLVIHLNVEYDWDQLSDRKKAIHKGLQIFNGIAQKAEQIEFAGNLLIENLEFPLYPALSSEIIEIDQMIETCGNKKFGTALDLGHLLHTANLLNINRDKGDPILPFLNDPFVSGETNFNNYLNDLLFHIGPRLKLLHVAGAHDHETHLLPTIDYCGNDRTQLDLINDLSIISTSINGSRLPVINEAHCKSYFEMVNACKLIQSHI